MRPLSVVRWDCLSGNGNIRTTILVNEVVMNYGNSDSWSVNVDRRIALALRKDPRLLGVFERRLRSKMATARSTAALGDDDWEWYVILTHFVVASASHQIARGL